MFAAVNTVEPPILDLQTAKFLEADKSRSKERLPLVQDRIRDRIDVLSSRLSDADWLGGAFIAAKAQRPIEIGRVQVNVQRQGEIE